jgi:Rrf2 family protein
MRMNEGVEWAAHCATLLAALPEGTVLPAGRLAEYHDIPAPYLAKALQALMRVGIVEATPGRHGGYQLGRPAAEITLLDIVRAVDGDGPFFRCTEIRRRGPSRVTARAYSPTCGIAASMWRAEQAWEDELRTVTVAQLLAETLEQAPPAALEKSVTWVTQVLSTRIKST